VRRAANSDSTACPLTDLMTSLMVIFVLLLLVFVNNQTVRASSAASFSKDVSHLLDLPASGIKVVQDSREFYTVTIGTPIRFQPGQSQLNDADRVFLGKEFP
jgi:hypothetical protein